MNDAAAPIAVAAALAGEPVYVWVAVDESSGDKYRPEIHWSVEGARAALHSWVENYCYGMKERDGLLEAYEAGNPDEFRAPDEDKDGDGDLYRVSKVPVRP